MDLTAFINAYRGPLIGLIVSWGVPWADASELAQDSFAEAWLKREYCRGDWTDPEVFGRWLRGIAHNKYRNWWRRHRRFWFRIASIDASELPERESGPDPKHTQRLEALRHAVDRLPNKQKQVVLMHYLEETSVKEVAALLSVSVKTVEGRLYQARRSLYRMLEKAVTSDTARRFLCLLI